MGGGRAPSATAVVAVLLLAVLMMVVPTAQEGPLLRDGPVGGRDPRLLSTAAQDPASIKADILAFKANVTAEAEAAAAKALQEAWADYKARWRRNYTADEDAAHLARFNSTLNFVREYNAKLRGAYDAFAGLGPLADATPDETRRLVGFNPTANVDTSKLKSALLPTATFGASGSQPVVAVNWINLGKVAPIQNQLDCGACWAFAATAVVESMRAIQYGINATWLSEQQVIDCSPSQFLVNGNACAGTVSLLTGLLFPYAFQGLSTYEAYPYMDTVGTCNNNAVNQVVNLTTVGTVTPQNETALMLALQQGPVIVGISASSYIFHTYTGGVLSDADACATCVDPSTGKATTCSVDHAVTMVGYNLAEGYWIIRNSWGPDWGAGGYLYLAMGTNNGAYPNGVCNVLAMPPVAAAVLEPGTSSQQQPVVPYDATLASRAVVNHVLFSNSSSPNPPVWNAPPPPPNGGAASLAVPSWHSVWPTMLLAFAVLLMA